MPNVGPSDLAPCQISGKSRVDEWKLPPVKGPGFPTHQPCAHHSCAVDALWCTNLGPALWMLNKCWQFRVTFSEDGHLRKHSKVEHAQFPSWVSGLWLFAVEFPHFATSAHGFWKKEHQSRVPTWQFTDPTHPLTPAEATKHQAPLADVLLFSTCHWSLIKATFTNLVADQPPVVGNFNILSSGMLWIWMIYYIELLEDDILQDSRSVPTQIFRWNYHAIGLFGCFLCVLCFSMLFMKITKGSLEKTVYCK